jgi:hypothetical protein
MCAGADLVKEVLASIVRAPDITPAMSDKGALTLTTYFQAY